MGGVPTKHHSHGKTRRRRSHSALKAERLFVCPNCKAPKRSHQACPSCGFYVKKERAKKAS